MAKKGIFNNPIHPKEEKTGKLSNTMSRDEIDSSNFFEMGTSYGTGYKNPTGSERPSSKEGVPKGCYTWTPKKLG